MAGMLGPGNGEGSTCFFEGKVLHRSTFPSKNRSTHQAEEVADLVDEQVSGCSKAAKWPPLSSSFQ
jgi:hypothetical protein